MTVPPEKPQILGDAQKQVEFITEQYKRGLMTEEERYKAVVKTWFDADDVLTDKLISGLDRLNNIFMMADSGARGSNQQIKQLAGMRGLMADTSVKVLTYWNTLFQHMVLVKVCLIQPFVQPIQDT